jgi:hypothetical protein
LNRVSNVSGSAVDRDWWRGAVIYEIYPRSFQDTTGDGVGDLAGITRRLAYLAELGVDAIWIAPFFQSPMKDFGYDVSNYTAVDPLFGTLADFDDLIAEAKRLGIKVMIDQVLSHGSRRAARAATTRSTTGTSGPIRSPTARRPTTGCRSSAAPPGSGTRAAASTTSTISWSSSPTSTSITGRCRTRSSTRSASGWSAASTVSASTR